MKKLILGIVALILIMSPAMALEYITSSNFAQPHIVLTPSQQYYFGGEKVNLSYTIAPRTESDATLITGDLNTPRIYDLYTNLKDPHWEIKVLYGWSCMGPTKIIHSTSNKVELSIVYWKSTECKGLSSIEVNLTGYMPTPTKRFEKVKIFWVEVSEAAADSLPPVNVYLVNKNLFIKSINFENARLLALEKRISKVSACDITQAKSYYDKAKNALADAKSLFNSNRFYESNLKLEEFDSYIKNATVLLNKSLALCAYTNVKDKFNGLYNTELKAEYYLNESKKKGFDVLKYEIKLKTIKLDINQVKNDLDKVKTYIDNAEYLLAINSSKKISSKIDEINSSLAVLLENLTALAQKKPSPFGFMKGLEKISSYIMYIAIACGIAVVAAIIIVLRGRRGGKWDELR